MGHIKLFLTFALTIHFFNFAGPGFSCCLSNANELRNEKIESQENVAQIDRKKISDQEWLDFELEYVLKFFDIDSIKQLLNQGANIDKACDKRFRRSLFSQYLLHLNRQLEKDKIDKIEETFDFLLQIGGEPNSFYWYGNPLKRGSPLIIAIESGLYEVAKLLIFKYGAKINARTQTGHTALKSLIDTVQYDYFKEDIVLFNYIIEHSDLHTRDKENKNKITPLFYAALLKGVISLEVERRIKKIIEILIKNGADIYAKDSKNKLLLNRCGPIIQNFIKTTYKFYKESTQKELLESTQNLLPTALSMLSLSYLGFSVISDGSNSEQIITTE